MKLGLDSISMELDERFSNVVQQCSGFLHWIPSVITNNNGNFAITDQQIREAIQLFEDDLPHRELWRKKYFTGRHSRSTIKKTT